MQMLPNGIKNCLFPYILFKLVTGAGEMVQCIRATMAALPEDPGSVPRIHMVAYNLVK